MSDRGVVQVSDWDDLFQKRNKSDWQGFCVEQSFEWNSTNLDVAYDDEFEDTYDDFVVETRETIRPHVHAKTSKLPLPSKLKRNSKTTQVGACELRVKKSNTTRSLQATFFVWLPTGISVGTFHVAGTAIIQTDNWLSTNRCQAVEDARRIHATCCNCRLVKQFGLRNSRMQLDDIFEFFETHSPSGFTLFASEGDQADFAAFESELGFPLPPEFLEFSMSQLGGMFLEATEDVWPRPARKTAAPFWTFLYGLKVFGISADTPEWLDLRVQIRVCHDSGIKDLVPFLQRLNDPIVYCFDTEQRIISWDKNYPTERQIEEIDFNSLVLQELQALFDRKDRYVRGDQS